MLCLETIYIKNCSIEIKHVTKFRQPFLFTSDDGPFDETKTILTISKERILKILKGALTPREVKEIN